MLKKAISIFTVACMLTSSLAINVFAQNSTTNQSIKRFDTTQSISSKNPRKPGQLIIKYKSTNSLKSNKSIILKNGGKVLKSTKDGLALVEFPEEKISEKIISFGQNKGVEYVVPNYIRKVTEFPKDPPNDPNYKKQYGLKNINAPEAWATLGDTSSLDEVKVAVIDTGLDMKHEDLKDRITAGYDFVDMDEDPSPGPIYEEHATHVAGIIAASTNNKIGVAGTAGTAPIKIMPLRVLEAGSGDDYTIAQAINYAADNGAKVINMSLGGYGDSPLLTEACNYAFSKNVVVVASSGNNAMDARNFSPASIPGVITVAATDSDNSLAYFSNYGSTVELSAPGVDVLSSLPGNKYEAYSGTSMSAPFVASACALLLSQKPNLSIIEVEQYLTDSAKDLGIAGKDDSFGYGLLDLNKALSTTSISPRLEILNVSNNSTLFDLVDIQTRFTYPENIVTTNLYVDDIVVQSVSNSTVEQSDTNLEAEAAESVISNKMFTNFELDTYKFKDGSHTLKVVAEDVEKQLYSKEIKINIRNKVYTGLRVNLKHEGTPVNGAYVEVWNKFTQEGQTYYSYVYSGQTNKNGIAIVPGSVAPNGNDYVIAASFEFNNGDELSQATVVQEASAPGVIEMNSDNLVPVTIETGLTCPNQFILANYKFPGSDQGFAFTLAQTDSDGSFDTYMNPGTYSFDAICNTETINEETGELLEQGPIYMLHTDETEITSENFFVTMDSNVDSLANIDLSYQDIHGFFPQDTVLSINLNNSMLSCGFYLNDISNIPELYITPGSCSYSLDITGEKGDQKAYIALGGEVTDLDAGTETLVNFGDTFTGKMKLEKTSFVPGEDVYINSTLTDSYGNRLLYMDYVYEDILSELKGKNIVSYKTEANKVAFKSSDAAIKALEEPGEPVTPEEPIVIEYKYPATLSLVDSKNNVIKTENQFSVDFMYTTLPQSLATDKYKLKLILDLPYLIQTEASLNVSRVIKNNAVKFTIELPDKTKATSATVEVIDTNLGYGYSVYGDDLINGEMFVAVPKGNYKFIVNAVTYKTIIPSATPAPTETAEPTASASPTPTETAEPTASASPTPTETVKPTASASPAPTKSVEPTASASPAPTKSVEPTASASPTPTETVKPTASASPAPTKSVEPTASASPAPTKSVKPTASASPAPTETVEPTASASPASTETVEPTASASPASTETVEPTASASPAPTKSVKPTASTSKATTKSVKLTAYSSIATTKTVNLAAYASIATTETAEPTASVTPEPTATVEPIDEEPIDEEPIDEEPIQVIDKSILYIKDGKSPANYSLSPSQLQNIKLSVKDEAGKEINNPSMYYLSIPLSTRGAITEYIGYFDETYPMYDLYISKGTYNFGTEVYDKNGSMTERLIFKPKVVIGSKPLKTQTVEFTSDNLTEVSLDSKSDKKSLDVSISDSNTGFNGWLYLLKGKSVKVSKGTYDLDYLSENVQYGNTYIYSLNSTKDFTRDNTVLNCGSDFSISITPNKSIYKAGETLKSTNMISDRYGNRLVNIYSYDLFNFFSNTLRSSKGSVILRKDQGKLKLYDIKAKDYIDISYYDIRAPFMYIKDSFGDIIHAAKSSNFYTNSQIKLDPEWAFSGSYKLVLTLDIDANGNKSGETTFTIR